MFVLLLRTNRAQLKKQLFDPSTKKNAHEFQKVYIRPHLAVDSAQWDYKACTDGGSQNRYSKWVGGGGWL